MKFDDVPEELRQVLVCALTLDNPDYKKVVRYGFRTDNIPPRIRLYRCPTDTLILPRGMTQTVIRYLKTHNIPFNIDDKRLIMPKVEFKSYIKLRDYQQTAVNKMLKQTQGFLVSPCGSGKTVMMIEMMARIKQPTLFIVHQKELMEQIINTAEELTDVTKEEIGIIGAGKKSIGKRMTVATIQTLNKMDLTELTDQFGAVFVDEAHHVAAKTFYDVITQFKGCYRFAVSATPERSDGLTQMVFSCTAGIVHEITQEDVPTIIPRLKTVKTPFSSLSEDYSYIVKSLIHNKERNQFIVDCIKKEAPNNYSLVLSDRVEHLKIVKEMIEKELPNLRVEILTGNVSKAKRKKLMEEARAQKIDILLATQLAREGLDIPHLNRLFLIYPKKSPASVQQEVGRVMRPFEGKENAVVFDFIDNNGILYGQFNKRKSVYKKIGMKMGA